VLGPILFLAYVNDIWRNIESNVRLFTDDRILYRRIYDNRDVDKLQSDLNKLAEWALENEMRINPDPLLLRKCGSAGNRTRTSGLAAKNSDH
jgi:hypothetical protein